MSDEHRSCWTWNPAPITGAAVEKQKISLSVTDRTKAHLFYRWNSPSQKKSSMRCATANVRKMHPIAMGRMKIFEKYSVV